MLDTKLLNDFSLVAARAAYASSLLKGKGDKIAADQAAVDSMRNDLNKISMNGKIVIGEGEMDEAPMLYIGEKLGTGDVAGEIATSRGVLNDLGVQVVGHGDRSVAEFLTGANFLRRGGHNASPVRIERRVPAI